MKLIVNIDIELLRIPCSIISIDYKDIIGSNSYDINIQKNIKKFKLNRKGENIGECNKI